MQINAYTKCYGVIGDPVHHSLSPILHNWIFKRHHLPSVYLAFHVLPDQLESAIHSLRALGLGGFNVTVPHKEKVTAFLDHPTREVLELGAANTLYWRNEKLCGDNTDPYGFLRSVNDWQRHLKGVDAMLIGAGGSARSIARALAQCELKSLLIANRSQERAETLVTLCETTFGLNAHYIPLHVAHDYVSQVKLVVNTTSVGMAPDRNRSPLPRHDGLNPEHLVYDLIYNPECTRLLAEARSRGAAVRNGLDMLIYQGIRSLEIWFERKFPVAAEDLTTLRQHLTMELDTHG